MNKLIILFLPFLAACSSQVYVDYLPSSNIRQIAFGSCNNQVEPSPLLWKVQSHNPDLFLALGDNIYANRPELLPISKAYARQLQKPEFLNLVKNTPILATWDDNDYAQNDGGGDNPLKFEAKTEFRDFFPLSSSQIPDDRDGIYYSVTLKDQALNKKIQIIMLDTRWSRSALNPGWPADRGPGRYIIDEDPEKTILGPEQWKWLSQELELKVDFRIIVSSIQVIPMEHGFEKWANLARDRIRLIDLINEKSAQNTLILSGDRHRAEVSSIKLKSQYILHEVTVGAINVPNTLGPEKNKFRVGEFLYGQPNFGLLKFDWESNRALVEIRDKDNQVINITHIPITSQ